jgi:hypothetical protein
MCSGGADAPLLVSLLYALGSAFPLDLEEARIPLQSPRELRCNHVNLVNRRRFREKLACFFLQGLRYLPI